MANPTIVGTVRKLMARGSNAWSVALQKNQTDLDLRTYLDSHELDQETVEVYHACKELRDLVNEKQKNGKSDNLTPLLVAYCFSIDDLERRVAHHREVEAAAKEAALKAAAEEAAAAAAKAAKAAEAEAAEAAEAEAEAEAATVEAEAVAAEAKAAANEAAEQATRAAEEQLVEERATQTAPASPTDKKKYVGGASVNNTVSLLAKATTPGNFLGFLVEYCVTNGSEAVDYLIKALFKDEICQETTRKLFGEQATVESVSKLFNIANTNSQPRESQNLLL